VSNAMPMLFALEKQASARQLFRPPHVASRIFLVGSSGNT
jgi:hypothetical protein